MTVISLPPAEIIRQIAHRAEEAVHYSSSRGANRLLIEGAIREALVNMVDVIPLVVAPVKLDLDK